MPSFDRVRLLVIADQTTFAEWDPALRARGFEPLRSGAREARAAAIRELPGAVLVAGDQGAGYLVCQQFKKDRTLRRLPLVLARLPAATAEKHAALLVRADGYAVEPATPEVVAAAVESAAQRLPRVVLPEGGPRLDPLLRAGGGPRWTVWLAVVCGAAAALLALSGCA